MKLKAYETGYLAAAGSFLLLGGAFFFQMLGYAPCAMCLWQRYPHAAAILIGILILAGFRTKIMYLLGAAAAAVTAGLGIFHTGVERDWWEGPTTCTGSGNDLGTLSGSDLLSMSDVPKLVMCDVVVWDFLTLSMASWNAIFSIILVFIWMLAFKQRNS